MTLLQQSIKTMKYRIKPIIVVAGLFSFLALGLYSCGTESHSQPPATKNSISVTILEISDKHFQYGERFLPAQVAAQKDVNLSSRIMGTLQELTVQEGDLVKKGQILARINKEDLIAQKAQAMAGVAQAETALATIEKDFKRIEKLHQSGSATDKQLDDISMAYDVAKSQLSAAKQAVRQLEVQLSYSTIVAPFDGYVAQRFQQQGSMVSPGMPILSLQGEKGRKIKAMSSEQDVALFAIGQKKTVHFPSLEKTLLAEVVSISPNKTTASGQYEIQLLPETSDPTLKAGLFAKVMIKENDGPMSIWVPNNILHHRGGLDGIFVANKQKKALLRYVRLGEKKETMVEILSGLNKGDQVIASSKSPLNDGAAISF